MSNELTDNNNITKTEKTNPILTTSTSSNTSTSSTTIDDNDNNNGIAAIIDDNDNNDNIAGNVDNPTNNINNNDIKQRDQITDNNNDTNANNISLNTPNIIDNNNTKSNDNRDKSDNNSNYLVLNSKISERKGLLSSIKSDTNPLTISRLKKIDAGHTLIAHFDERVTVHTVPYWDPCGETHYDTEGEDGPRGPQCCIIL